MKPKPINGHAALASITEHPALALRERVLQRVIRSHAHESQFHTVRRDAGAWQQTQAGARSKLLASTGVARSMLVELSPSAALECASGQTQQEFVLLGGQLSMGTEVIACGDVACTPHDAVHTLRAGAAGASLYLRLSDPAESAVLPSRFQTLVDDSSWQDFCPGVRIKVLWSGGARSSVLVRMRAGAHVNAHSHALEEECLMLAGEAFIGDTLLRGGEYQLAPQGSRHGAIQTDVGALFYVHGSLDPAAYA
ncbi:MAG: cupin domain-containing protein [Burkholderiaceae bacterium]